MKVNYVIVFVSNMERSVAFYQGTLGLSLKFQTAEWTEFATEGATLALHRSEERTSTAGTEEKHAAGDCRPGLNVENLDEFHARMIENKVPCIQEPRDVFGARLAQYADPDGVVISVGEAAK